MSIHRCNFSALCASIALALAAGCAGGSQIAPSSQAGPQTQAGLQTSTRPQTHKLAHTAGWLSPAAKKCKQRLYVASYRLGYVDIYCTKGRNQAPIGQITDGINGPEGLSVDAKGNLYVTNTSGNTVTEYARNSTTPSFTYTSELGYPAGVAVDASQNVYVTSLSPASVTIFPQQSNSPTSQVTNNLTYPIDVALDANGNFYVTTYTPSFSAGEIIEYGPGSSQGTNLGITTDGPGGIVLDKSGDIVTADQRLPGVLVFPPGKTTASLTFGQNALDPDPIRLSHNEKQAYVGDPVANEVFVFDYPSGKLVDTITDGVDGPNGVALDPAAPLYR